MFYWLVYLAVIVAIALVVLAIVLIGMRGGMRKTVPGVSSFLAKTARHLNGDAEPPVGLVDFFEKIPMPSNHQSDEASKEDPTKE